MKDFSGVIFDMDGLLLDSERIALETFAEACVQLALGDQTALFYRCIGTNQQRGEMILAEGLAGKIQIEAFSACWEQLHQARVTAAPIPVKPGALALLEVINGLGLPVAVATSTATARAREKLRDAGLLDYFHHIVGGDCVQRSKPEPDIYLQAAQVLNIVPGRALALEDSENGVLAALAAGMTVVQVPDLVQPSAEFRRHGHWVLASLNDVSGHRFH